MTVPTMKEIAALVAEHHGITLDEIRGPSRVRRVAWPRQEAMALMRKNTPRSYPQIGAYFHRDHTTALYGVKRHELRLRGENSPQTSKQSVDGRPCHSDVAPQISARIAS